MSELSSDGMQWFISPKLVQACFGILLLMSMRTFRKCNPITGNSSSNFTSTFLKENKTKLVKVLRPSKNGWIAECCKSTESHHSGPEFPEFLVNLSTVMQKEISLHITHLFQSWIFNLQDLQTPESCEINFLYYQQPSMSSHWLLGHLDHLALLLAALLSLVALMAIIPQHYWIKPRGTDIS